MTRYAIKLLLLGLILASINACGDDPTSAGLSLIPDKDYVRKDTLDSYNEPIPFTTNFFRDTVNTASSLRTLVGHNGNLTARGIYRFAINVPDSVYNFLVDDTSSIKVISSTIDFKKSYNFGDSSSPFDVKMYNLTSSYSTSAYKPEDFEYSEDKNIATEITENDTSVTISVDQSQVKIWMLNNVNNEKFFNYGAVMVPSENMDKIIGIPTLTSGNTGYPQLSIIYERAGFYTDTLIADATLDLYLTEGGYDINPVNHIVIRGGLTSKGILKYDLSNLDKTVIISEAKLTLFLDEELSDGGSPSPDSITAAMLREFSSTDTSVYVDYGAVYLKRDGNQFTGDISKFVQRWVTDVPNEGLWLAVKNETSNVARYALYGSKPEGATLWQEPRLILYYTVK